MKHSTPRTPIRQAAQRRRTRRSPAAATAAALTALTTLAALTAVTVTPAVAASGPRPAQQSTVRGALLTDDFYERLRHPDGGLLAALEAQDGTCDWKPTVPVQLHSAAGDTDVAIANSLNCAADLARNGVTAPVVDHQKADHNTSFELAAPHIVRWFDTLAHR